MTGDLLADLSHQAMTPSIPRRPATEAASLHGRCSRVHVRIHVLSASRHGEAFHSGFCTFDDFGSLVPPRIAGRRDVPQGHTVPPLAPLQRQRRHRLGVRGCPFHVATSGGLVIERQVKIPLTLILPETVRWGCPRARSDTTVIKIGDFARLSHVSVATLRHYDEIGLLTPSVVDRVTGYRYYAVAQLPRLNRIVALKDLGFSLDQIQRVLQDCLTLDQLRGMLMLKQAEVEQHVAVEQARLDRIVAQLRRIEQEDRMPEYDVALKNVPSTLVAARRVTIPRNDEVPEYLGPAFAEASDHVKRQRAKEAGPCLAVWHQAAAVRTDEEADAAVPIDRPIPGTDRVAIYTLPPARVASVVHHHQGDSDDFTQGHATLLSWIETNGYCIVGPYREVYIGHDPGDMADAATEIQYPVDTAV